MTIERSHDGIADRRLGRTRAALLREPAHRPRPGAGDPEPAQPRAAAGGSSGHPRAAVGGAGPGTAWDDTRAHAPHTAEPTAAPAPSTCPRPPRRRRRSPPPRSFPRCPGRSRLPSTAEAPREPDAATPPGPPRAAEPPAAPGVDQWEWRLGGTWLSRAGAVLLILGVGFFLKHAFEHDWIGPRGRVLAGLAAGIVMMAGGTRLAGGGAYQVPAQSLIALGMGVLYLSLYAAHALYALAGPTPAFLAHGARDGRGLRDGAPPGRQGPRDPRNGGRAPDAGHPRHRHRCRDGALHVPPHPGPRRAAGGASSGAGPALALLAFVGTQALYWGWLDRWYEVDRLPAALGWATAFFLAFAAGALAGSRMPRPAGTVELARLLLVLAVPAVYFSAARHVLDDPPAGVPGAPGLGARRPLLGGGARRGRERPRRSSGRALPPRGRAGVPGARTRGDARAPRPGDRMERPGPGTPGRRFRAGRTGASRGGSPDQRCSRGGDGSPRSRRIPAGRGRSSSRIRPCRPPWRSPSRRRSGPSSTGRASGRLRRSAAWERRRAPDPAPGRGRKLALLLTVELSQFRTLAIPPPYVPVMKSVVWMLAGWRSWPWRAVTPLGSCSPSRRCCCWRWWARPWAGRRPGRGSSRR